MMVTLNIILIGIRLIFNGCGDTPFSERLFQFVRCCVRGGGCIVRIYGRWVGLRQGRREDPKLCVVQVYPAHSRGMLGFQCSRKRKAGAAPYAGMLCTQHAQQQAAGFLLRVPDDEMGAP